MHFRVAQHNNLVPNCALIYRPEDYAFDVIPTPEGGFASALFNDLNVEMNAEGRVISIWGLCPHTRWKEAVLTPPAARFGEVIFVPDGPLNRGVSVQLGGNENRSVFVDRTSGWVNVTGTGDPESSVKILPGVIFDIDDRGNLCSIWLRPNELPALG